MVFFRIAPTVNLLALPLLLIYMLLFCSGLGMLLSALAVFFRDVCHLWASSSRRGPTPRRCSLWYSRHAAARLDAGSGGVQSHVSLRGVFHIAMYGQWPGIKKTLVALPWRSSRLQSASWYFKRTEKKFILYV